MMVVNKFVHVDYYVFGYNYEFEIKRCVLFVKKKRKKEVMR